jgi:transcriptional regulator with XRE-family HTH domain
MSSTVPHPPVAVGPNLKMLRELRKLTQSELGHRASMSGASVSHFETGERAPSLDSLVRLADALAVPVDVLLGRTPVGAGAPVDPIFLRASHASTATLDTIRRVTEALLAAPEPTGGR